jgi:uncharacterized Zn-binding protein involved in type VI secretion
MAQITRQFDEPFNERNTGLPSWFSPSVVGLNGRPYLVDNEGGNYRRQGVDVVQQRNTSDSRDLLLLPQDVWRQMQQSWHFGAGQSNIDRDNALPYRYEDSYGIDPWNQWQIALLPETKRLDDIVLSGEIWLSVSGTYLTVVNGQKIYWYNSLSTTAAPIAETTVSSGYAILDIASDGLVPTVLAADRHIWFVNGPSGTPTKWTNHHFTVNVTFIAWEKDYLIVGDGNVLYNSIKSTSPTAIYTHPDTSFRWYSAASGSQFIYAMGRVGDRTTIHKIGIKADGTGLLPAIVAATLPDGEVGQTIDSYLGYIFIGTDKGVRMAQADGNGDLVLGAIIPTTQPVKCFEGQDRFVWYGNSAISAQYGQDVDDQFPTTTVCGLGRMDLTTFTTTSLTPAYADDICVPTETGHTVNSIVTYQGKRVFALNGAGVYFEGDDLMEAGWLKQGTMSFSVEDLKTGLYTQAKWLPLEGEIDIDLSYDSGAYERVAEFSIQGTVRSDNVYLDGRQFTRVNAVYTLGRSVDEASDGPTFTRWEIRAVPVKGRSSRWTIPIMNYDTIELDGVVYNRDVVAELDLLMNLCQNGSLFVLQESGRAYQVHAKDFLWQPEKLSANGKGWQGTFTMIVEEMA